MTAAVLLAHPATALALAALAMGIEAVISRRHERWLRNAGAVEPADDVYPWMQVVYPLGFVACVAEGWWRSGTWSTVVATGVLVFTGAKIIKYAAIATLGRRWTFRVLPLPGVPPVQHGLYRWLRHPNYVGVIGEIIGIGLWMRAPVAAMVFLLTFLWLLRRRIEVEERALALAAGR